MIFGKKTRKQVRELCRAEPTIEICGLLVYHLNEIKAFKCRNSSENPKENFTIHPKDYLKISLSGDEIVGIFHSHILNNNEFSLPDKINSSGLNLKSLLYCIETDSFLEFTPEGYRSPYIGREFIWGEQDCLSLVIDYYNNELKLNISGIFDNRDANIFTIAKNGWDFTSNKDRYNKYGFIKVDENIYNLIFKKNDLILIKSENNIPNHAAIYLGGNKILHQPRNHFSLIENLEENVKFKIHEVLRLC